MKTQLIILGQGNIIVSDEKIKEGDWYFLNTTRMKIASPTGVYRQSEKEVVCKLNNLSCNIQKVIVSDNPEHNQPTIDYSALSDEDCEKIGYINVENYSKLEFPPDFNVQGDELDYYERMAFIKGFKKAQSLNDKKFSLEDMKKAYYSGRGFGKLMETHNWYCFEKSLQQPKVFDVEVEMERTRYPKDDDGWEDIYNPKITNNSIKITKIL